MAILERYLAKVDVAIAEPVANLHEMFLGVVQHVAVSVKIHKQSNVFQEERAYPKSADPRKSRG